MSAVNHCFWQFIEEFGNTLDQIWNGCCCRINFSINKLFNIDHSLSGWRLLMSKIEGRIEATTIISAPHLLCLPPTDNMPTIPVTNIMAIRLTFQQAFCIKMSMLVILLVVYHNSIRNRNYLHRQCILHPHLLIIPSYYWFDPIRIYHAP